MCDSFRELIRGGGRVAMLRKKEIITVVGTLGIAVGVGFAMQSGDTAKERYGAAARPMAAFAGTPAVPMSEQASADIFLEVEEIELTSASEGDILPALSKEASVLRVAAPAKSDLPELERDMPPRATPRVEDCVMAAIANPIAGAMVDLKMTAPCAVNERLTVHHNGMMFTATTDAEGSLNLVVPALTEQAVFILAFSNGDGAVAQTQVDDLENYDRVAVQWRGQAGFQLHAREFGADYGKPGHVWSGIASDVKALKSGEHGVLIQLGDSTVAEPLMAEVYTFPSGTTKQDGAINLSVEAEVTMNNCGLDIEAQSIEIIDNGSLKTQDLILAVPDCDAVGSFLVLNNLVSDLKVASN